MKNRILSLALVLLFIFALCGCGEKKKTDSTTPETSTSQNKTEEKEDNKTSKEDIPDEDDSSKKEESDEKLTPEAFCTKFEGTWTANDGTFIDFAFEEGKPTAFFAIWEAGGYFPAGEIKSVKEISQDEYTLEIFFPGTEGNDMYDAVESYTESFNFKNHNNGNITVTGNSDSKTYFYDGRMQYPMEY